jgi:hypothetical protein
MRGGASFWTPSPPSKKFSKNFEKVSKKISRIRK